MSRTWCLRSRTCCLVLFSALTPLISSDASGLESDDVLVADFEGDTYGEWTSEGAAFGSAPARGTLQGQMHVSGYRGERLVNSFFDGDRTVGALTSPEFEITRDFIAFLVGGGRHPEATGIELLLEGKPVRRATGTDSEELGWHSWNVKDLRGKRVRLRIFDRHTGGWGHINVDHILLTDRERRRPEDVPIEVYRKSPEYYRERYRPQFHFSPEVNWMNDPNGLVYAGGEYHLFYQYNPWGIRWGHMSWGHAVSTDLVHWKHLPVALYEENGVMIFSGCAVVDAKNTSGFGTAARPPLVAIYTGHTSKKQDQRLAYSIDRGRTWTKYGGNPVLDMGEKDFRDPKVFWHEPTSRWVMVVSLAAAKRLQFYGSTDLKEWTHLSDFGPAGKVEKPNWECPDLFELPIEGRKEGTPGSTRWVLEVDMGSGSIAGGSGGEYFVGTFDGERFVNDNPDDQVLWVDYGRDFYAAVSFSDIPARDGRRIWIGWFNNWETALLPTKPWRSAQSIPRTLSLRETKDGLRLVQRPVRELTRLRGEPYRLDAPTSDLATVGRALASRDFGLHYEIDLEIEVRDAKSCGIEVRKGNSETTPIGFDRNERDQNRGEVFVDRTGSGDGAFHKRFPGRHAGPVELEDGRVGLRIFVDTSSVEVFAQDGILAISDRIFPSPESRGIELFSRGGSARLTKLVVWPLRSIWHSGAGD